ncbi:MAG: glycosyltransferase family 4 protein [Atribacterota bacterium]
MKICYIGDAASIHTKRWVEWFVNKGYDVHLITDRSGYIHDTTIHRVKEGRSPISFAMEALSVKKLIKKIKPDIVHAHYVSSYGFFGAYSGFHPFIVSAWGSDILVDPQQSKFVNRCVKYTLKKADVITTDGKNTYDEMLNNLGADIDKLNIIYHGVNTKMFSPDKKDDNFSKEIFNEKCPIAISVRFLNEKNDMETFLKAIPLILEKIKNAKFIIGGNGPKKDELIDLANSLKISNNVYFTDYIKHDDLPRYLASSNVYVSTALWDGGISVVTLDAMSCGLPIISTDIANASQWIQDNENGFLIETKDYKTLAEKLIFLLQFTETSKRLGEKNRNIIEEKQNEDIEMSKVAYIYRKYSGED